MDFAQITVRLQSLWQRVPQKRLTQALIFLLIVYIAYWSANFTWMVSFDNKHMLPEGIVSSPASTTKRQINTTKILKLNLFGEYNKEKTAVTKVEPIESAPETRLKLTLTGLVASDDPATAAAIIESKGRQNTYGIDDKIEGTRAILKQVHTDRVIIESSGRMESLMLDGFEYTKKATNEKTEIPPKRIGRKNSLANKRKVDLAINTRIKDRVTKARADILDNPGKLTDYIKVSPHREDGKVKGYRLMPSKDPEFFADVGLISGDIAVQINGKDLTDMREAQQALIELRIAEHVDLLVERNGELLSVSLGLNN